MPEMPVFLVDYDVNWPTCFSEERARIIDLLADHNPSVEHIGSTAISGMAAKPIIDVMVLIGAIADAPACIERLKSLDYHYSPYGEDVFPERRWFCKPNPTERTHHLHLVERNTPFHIDHLLFRNYLRTHKDVAHSYEDLKRQLATRFPDDREAYTDGKSGFVAGVLAKARPSIND